VCVNGKLSAVVDAGESGGTDSDRIFCTRPDIGTGDSDSSGISSTPTTLESRGDVKGFSVDLCFRECVGLVELSTRGDLAPASVDAAVEEAAVSTAAEGLAGRDEAGVGGLDETTAAFLSLPRPLPPVDPEFASLIVLDDPGAVADTERLPLVPLVGRPFGAEEPANGVVVADASRGVPPFCPHEAERGSAGARNASNRYRFTWETEAIHATYRQARQLCCEMEA